jgi:predicted membrane-bound spermidine synthase
LFFISGLLMGLEFPLAAKIYSKESDKVGATVGLLYGSDLIGGWVAAIFGGIIFLPILGLFNTCMVIVALKLGSLGLLVAANRR